MSRLGDRLSYYTTRRLLNHRTSDVTQGYVQFDLEQLRSAMQAVEDFVLQKVAEKAAHHIRALDANERPSQAYAGRVTPSMPYVFDARAAHGLNIGPAD